MVTTAISRRRRRSFHERSVGVVPEASDIDQAERLAGHDDVWAQVGGLPPRQRASPMLRLISTVSGHRPRRTTRIGRPVLCSTRATNPSPTWCAARQMAR
jgi:hypothetical protein